MSKLDPAVRTKRRARNKAKALASQAKRAQREAKNGLIGKLASNPKLGDVSFSDYRNKSTGRARMVRGGAPGSGKRK